MNDEAIAHEDNEGVLEEVVTGAVNATWPNGWFGSLWLRVSWLA